MAKSNTANNVKSGDKEHEKTKKVHTDKKTKEDVDKQKANANTTNNEIANAASRLVKEPKEEHHKLTPFKSRNKITLIDGGSVYIQWNISKGDKDYPDEKDEPDEKERKKKAEYKVGDVFYIINNSSSTNVINIVQNSDTTLYRTNNWISGGKANTGTVKVAPGGYITISCTGSNTFHLYGSGIIN